MIRYSQEHVEEEFISRGMRLIDLYRSANLPVDCQCACGKLTKLSFTSVRKGAKCSDCRSEKMRKLFALKEHDLCAFLKSRGFCRIAGEYVNAKSNILIKCSTCEKSYVTTYDSLQQGSLCRFCQIDRLSDSQKLDYDYVDEFFSKHGCILLSEVYCSAHHNLKFMCSCGRTSHITWNNFRDRKQCSGCGLDGRSAENHYMWIKDREYARLRSSVRSRAYKLLRVSSQNYSLKSLGYTWETLLAHLESFENFKFLQESNDWHIDHVFPIKAFLDYGVFEVKLINSLSNLQPLSGLENLRKGSAYNKADFLRFLGNIRRD